jgi:hypothetical protein
MSPEWITVLLALALYGAIVTALLGLTLGGNSNLAEANQKLRDSHQDLLAKLYGRP